VWPAQPQRIKALAQQADTAQCLNPSHVSLDGPYKTADEPAEDILSCLDEYGPIYEAWSRVISHERLLKICETAVAIGGEVVINEIKHVRALSGLIPA